MDVETLAEHPSPTQSPDEMVELEEQVAMVRQALQRLPASEREVLYDFVSNADPSERSLAERHSLTRYRLREVLANGIGRLASDLADVPDSGAIEAKVAKHLWNEGRSSRNVASLLGISVPEVQAARLRFATELLASIRQFNNRKSSETKTMNPDLQILKDALLSVGDPVAIQPVRGAWCGYHGSARGRGYPANCG